MNKRTKDNSKIIIIYMYYHFSLYTCNGNATYIAMCFRVHAYMITCTLMYKLCRFDDPLKLKFQIILNIISWSMRACRRIVFNGQATIAINYFQDDKCTKTTLQIKL